MKKIAILALALFGLHATAQQHNNTQDYGKEKGHAFFKSLTAQEMATLETKKMTLHLDLNAQQQEQMLAINLAEAKMIKEKQAKREQMKADKKSKPSKAERLQAMNAHLDAKIAQKQKVKAILSPEQLTKWENMQKKRKHHFKKGMQKHKLKKNARALRKERR